MGSKRERIGNKIYRLGEDGVCYLDEHQLLLWKVGMLITAIVWGIVFIHHVDEFLSIKMIVLSLLLIVCGGWMLSAILFLLPCCLLAAIGYIIINPLKTIKYLFIYAFVGVVIMSMATVFSKCSGVRHEALRKSIDQYQELNDSICSQQCKLQDLASEISSLAEQIEDEEYEDVRSQIIEKANEIEDGLDLDLDHYEIGNALYRLEELLDSISDDNYE